MTLNIIKTAEDFIRFSQNIFDIFEPYLMLFLIIGITLALIWWLRKQGFIARPINQSCPKCKHVLFYHAKMHVVYCPDCDFKAKGV